jgi:hypothetical protein
MTGYTVHTGASKKFVTGWDRVFGKAAKKSAKPAPAAKKPAAKKSRSK